MFDQPLHLLGNVLTLLADIDRGFSLLLLLV
jgi:hypothetical protein